MDETRMCSDPECEIFGPHVAGTRCVAAESAPPAEMARLTQSDIDATAIDSLRAELASERERRERAERERDEARDQTLKAIRETEAAETKLRWESDVTAALSDSQERLSAALREAQDAMNARGLSCCPDLDLMHWLRKAQAAESSAQRERERAEALATVLRLLHDACPAPCMILHGEDVETVEQFKESVDAYRRAMELARLVRHGCSDECLRRALSAYEADKRTR